MRLKHNKKRNTAFLFEALTREYVKSIIKKNLPRQSAIRTIIKEHFCSGILKEELSIYREIFESKELTKQQATGILEESKQRYDKLDKSGIFGSQNLLIREINHRLSPSVFTNFVPNYKDLATVYNIFNNKTSAKEKILLESRVIESLTDESHANTKEHVDNLTYKTFVGKFNEKYAGLPENQKELLVNYIAAFAGDDLSLKFYLNEQIQELKQRLTSLQSSDKVSGEEMQEKFEKVCSVLDSYKGKEIDDMMISEVLMVQELVREIDDA